MKKLTITITILLILLFSLPASAAEFNASYFKMIMESSEDINNPSSDGVIITGEKLFNDNPLQIYPWLSFENISSFGLNGQPLPHFQVIGAGLGFSKELVKDFKLFVNAGWFEPIWELNNSSIKPTDKNWSYWDRFHIYLAKEYSVPLNGVPYEWDEYNMNVSGNFGGIFGFNYNAEITKNLSFTAGAMYRLLTFDTIVDAYYDNRKWNWQKYDSMKLSGYAVTLGFTYNF